MKIQLIAVGTKMPAWVEHGFEEYRRRFPKDMPFELVEIGAGKRGKNADIPRILQKEGEAMLAAAGRSRIVILAKSGQHTIPYEVLEQARNEAKQLREQLAQSQQAQAERDKLAAVLEQNGIELDTSDPDSIDVAAIEELAQDYPDLGKPLAAIARKLQKLEQPAQPAINLVQAALQAVPDLVSWREKDQDRFDFAIIVDEKLQADPAWQGKSLDERFAEAARRTKLAFGDEVIPPAKAPSKEAEKPTDFIPSSPSALGQTHHAAPTGVERFGTMSQTELIGEMGAMTDAQMEALLEQAGF
jgi:hypothetical protein